MNSLPENFFPYEKLLVALVHSGVDFAVVGGVAVSLNGYVRATDGVDIIISTAPENIRKLLQCLMQWGEGWARELKEDDFSIETGAVRRLKILPSICSSGCGKNLWTIFVRVCGILKLAASVSHISRRRI